MEFIKDVTTTDFQQAVIEASHTVPVLVDFWAEWCGPCKALKPVLEKVANESAGSFVLAKVDTESEPELAARFGIRGIPNVKAFVDGRVVSEFSGAIPESAVRAFLAKLLPSPEEKERKARLDRISTLVADGAYQEADKELAEIPPRERDARAEELATRIEAWKRAQALPPIAELEARFRQNPADLAVRVELAERHIAERQYERALELLLEVVRKDRGALRERARKSMVEVFHFATAGANEAPGYVVEYRRQLSSALY
jgi:putative thioredoxin